MPRDRSFGGPNAHDRLPEAYLRFTGAGRRVELQPDHLAMSPADGDVEALDEALSRLAGEYPQQAELVQLRYFGGLTLEECANVLGVSARTADTWWAYARAWLAVELVPS